MRAGTLSVEFLTRLDVIEMQDILFIMNAPPRAGKDTLANRLKVTLHREDVLTDKVSFKAGLEYVAYSMLKVAGVYDWQWDEIYQNNKDEPLELLGGMSPRQFYIHLSESVMKPIFGSDVFANYMLSRIEDSQRVAYRNSQCVFLCSDGGFVEELETTIRAFKGKVIVLQWDSEGCSFAADSRSKLNPEQFPGVHFVTLPDNARDDLTVDSVRYRIQDLVRHPFLASPSGQTNLDRWLVEVDAIIKGLISDEKWRENM